jgi:hypothetical protein
MRAEFGARSAAEFKIRYEIESSILQVTLEDVKESPGFELIEISLPRLMTVREEEGSAWMAEGRHGGSL